jgi:hypothetical protein
MVSVDSYDIAMNLHYKNAILPLSALNSGCFIYVSVRGQCLSAAVAGSHVEREGEGIEFAEGKWSTAEISGEV